MDLSIVIVNYKTSKITADCLRSIQSSKDGYSKEVIVVDNDSGDDSVAVLKKQFPQFNIFGSGQNGGFAFGNNVGAAKARGEYIWLLNSDTILRRDTISKLMEAANQKGSDIATCMLLNPDGSLQPQGGALPTPLNLAAWMLFWDDLPVLGKLFHAYQQRSRNYFRSDQHPGWVGGTALLVRRSVYQKLGGLDQGIFMYGEDTDFCLRAHQAGYRIDYFASPRLTHLGQASGSSRGAVLGEYRGLKYLFAKHYPKKLPLLRFLLKIGALLRIGLFGMIGRDETRKNIYKEAFNLA
jgi:GT2 family glycosyltransferase